MKKLLTAIAIVTTIAQSCKKEPVLIENFKEVFPGCRLVQKESGYVKEKYILDDRNLVIEGTVTDNQDNVMSKTYEYVSGNRLSVIKTYSDKEKTQLSIVETFSKVGDRIIKEDQDLSNGTTKPFKRTEFVLNTKGFLESRKEYAYINGTEYLALTVEYETDINGNITVERQYNPDSSLYRSFVYTYDDKKNVHAAEPVATVIPVGNNNILSIHLLDANNAIQSEYHPQYQYDLEGYPVVEAGRWVYTYQCR